MNGEDCGIFRDLLPDFAASRLSAAQASQVEAHVARCDECAAELAVLNALGEGAIVPPPGLARRVRLAVEAELAGAGPAAPQIRLRGARRSWWRRFWAPVAVLATAVAALIVTRAVQPGAGSDPLDSAATLVANDTSVVAPFGDWPGADGVVAGLAMVDDLSTEQLQTLLDRMER
jgi:anti-sigma factor RsiW